MKEKHLKVLKKYEKYGETSNPSVNYNEKTYKLCNYGRKCTTRPTMRPSKLKLHARHNEQLKTFGEEKPIMALCGASIIQGLTRYQDIWNKYFAPLSAINLGIGGDRTEDILWRMENINLPPTVEFLVIHCGTNNLQDCHPSDIADGVLSIGAMAKKNNNNIQIIITGLLHCDLNDHHMRSNVAEVNNVLRRKCHKMDFTYMEQDADWMNKEDGSLDMDYYYKDHIHLNYQGNVKFANSIIRKIKATSMLSSSHQSSDILMRIPTSSEVVPHIDIPSHPTSPVSEPITTSYCTPRSVSPRVIDVPGPECDYDHAKAMAQLSHHSVHVPKKGACKRRPRLHLHGSSLSHMSSSSSSSSSVCVPSTSPCLHSTTSQPMSCSPSVVSAFMSTIVCSEMNWTLFRFGYKLANS